MKLYNNNIISWVDKGLSLGESSKSGQGTFASRNYKKDEVLIVQGGRIVSIEEIEEDTNNELSLAYHGFQVSERFYIYPIVGEDGVIFDGVFNVNHSCSPNAGFKDSLTLVCIRDIKEGEEICFDYVMTDMELPDEIPWETTMCNCGSSECRKVITGSDWKKTELQEKYAGYFSPYLARIIKQGV